MSSSSFWILAMDARFDLDFDYLIFCFAPVKTQILDVIRIGLPQWFFWMISSENHNSCWSICLSIHWKHFKFHNIGSHCQSAGFAVPTCCSKWNIQFCILDLISVVSHQFSQIFQDIIQSSLSWHILLKYSMISTSSLFHLVLWIFSQMTIHYSMGK